VRLQGVESSLGYALHFDHSNDGISFWTDADPWRTITTITAFNTGVDACSAGSYTCSFTRTWPSVTYASGPNSDTTDALGRTTHYSSGTSGGSYTYSIRRPSSSTNNLTYTYTGTVGGLTSVTRDGLTWGYSYSISGSTATLVRTDPLSHTRTYVSDLNVGLPTSVTDETGHTTTYTYDSSGRLTRATAPEGNYTSYTYDSRGNVTQTSFVPKSGSGLSTVTTSASYPSSCTNALTCNQPTSVTDGRGNTTDYTYDSTHGGVLTVTAPAPTTGANRPQTRYTYSGLTPAGGGTVYKVTAISACQTGTSCSGTSDEVKTSISYNSNLLPTSVSKGAGDASLTATTAITYDGLGNISTVDGPLSGTADTTMYRWDADSELVGVVSPDPDGSGSMKMRALRNTYNADGQVTKVEQGTVNSQSDSDWASFSTLQEVDTTYDSSARPVTKSLVSGGTTYALTQMSYDGEGRLQCTAVRMNPSVYSSLPSDACTLGTTGSYGSDRIVKTTYDAANRPTVVTSGYGVSGVQADDVTTAYTNNGKTASVTDAEGNKTSYVYDGFDRLYQTQYPSTTKGAGTSNSSDYEQFSYDASGNITSRRLRDGTSIAFTFDALNRMTYKDLPGSEPDVTYTYDLLGRMTGASQTGNSLSFTYDALGRNLTQVGPQGTVTSTWDIGGRRTRITHPDSFYLDQDYLVTGELQKIRENGATSGVGVLATYAYDDLGRRTSLMLGDGSSTSYSFDNASRLSQLSHDLSGTSYDQTLGFSYNPASEITQNTRSNDSYA
jgi:YD repeat-containing protein